MLWFTLQQKIPVVNYDSVVGYEGSMGKRVGNRSFAKQYIFYQSELSDPHFLITIQIPTQRSRLRHGSIVAIVNPERKAVL